MPAQTRSAAADPSGPNINITPRRESFCIYDYFFFFFQQPRKRPGRENRKSVLTVRGTFAWPEWGLVLLVRSMRGGSARLCFFSEQSELLHTTQCQSDMKLPLSKQEVVTQLFMCLRPVGSLRKGVTGIAQEAGSHCKMKK